MTPNELADALKLFSSLGAVGVLAWILLYVFRVEVPRRDAQFSQTLKENSTMLLGTIKEQREDFRRELEQIRAQHKPDGEGMWEPIDGMPAALAEHQHHDRRHSG